MIWLYSNIHDQLGGHCHTICLLCLGHALVNCYSYVLMNNDAEFRHIVSA